MKRRWRGAISKLRWRGGLFLKAAELVFQLRHAAAEAFQDFPGLGGNGHAVFAMMARGGAVVGGIFILLAAGAAGARALAGGGCRGHGKWLGVVNAGRLSKFAAYLGIRPRNRHIIL